MTPGKEIVIIDSRFMPDWTNICFNFFVTFLKENNISGLQLDALGVSYKWVALRTV